MSTQKRHEVREHPDHFLLVYPDGSQDRVAKNGISPKTHAKLAGFAKGGVVKTHFDDGGTPDFGDAPSQAAPNPSDIPAGEPLPEGEVPQDITVSLPPALQPTPVVLPNPVSAQPSALTPIVPVGQPTPLTSVQPVQGAAPLTPVQPGPITPQAVTGYQQPPAGVTQPVLLENQPKTAVPQPQNAELWVKQNPDAPAAQAYTAAMEAVRKDPTLQNVQSAAQAAQDVTAAATAPAPTYAQAQIQEQQAVARQAQIQAAQLQGEQVARAQAAQVEAARQRSQAANQDFILKQHLDLAQRLGNGSIDPKEFWDGKIKRDPQGNIMRDPNGEPMREGGKPWYSKMLAGVGMILGGAPAVDMVMKSVDRQIDAQKFDANRSQTLLGHYEAMYRDLPTAEAQVRADAYTVLGHQIETQAAGSKSQQVQAAAQGALAQLAQAQAVNTNDLVAKKQQLGIIPPGGTAQADIEQKRAAAYQAYANAAVLGGQPLDYATWKAQNFPGLPSNEAGQATGQPLPAAKAPSGQPATISQPKIRKTITPAATQGAPVAGSPQADASDASQYPGSTVWNPLKYPGNPYAPTLAHVPGAGPNVYGKLNGGKPDDIGNAATAFAKLGQAVRRADQFVKAHPYGAPQSALGHVANAVGLGQLAGLGPSGADKSEAEAVSANLLKAAATYNASATPSSTVEIESMSQPDLTKLLLKGGVEAKLRETQAQARNAFFQLMRNKMPGVTFTGPQIDKVWHSEAPASAPRKHTVVSQ